MNKKFIIAGAGLLIIIIIILQIANRSRSIAGINIMGDNNSISGEDYKNVNRIINFDDSSAKKYFSRLSGNQFTIKYFKYLQYKFSKMSYEESLEAVEKYLRSVMDPDRAEEMIALYKKFAAFEKSFPAYARKLQQPKNAEDMVQYLREVQEYRRTFYGKELADELYGTMVKAQEYNIRKGSILNDKNMYGSDKEKQIKELKSQMWGNDASVIDSEMEPFDRYQEKLSLYDKDLSGLNDADKKQKIREYRSEFFTPEVVAKLEKIDDDAAADKQKEESYRKLESKIMSDPSLTSEQKDAQLNALQKEIFGEGEDADEFRRRENIRKGLETN